MQRSLSVITHSEICNCGRWAKVIHMRLVRTPAAYVLKFLINLYYFVLKLRRRRIEAILMLR